ncbi:putative lasso peptide precursor [Planomonospora sphaerica]|uniref:Putative lasso peptide n=1 Tax=Planomonospora sphaerica TaxID=161355 RepID=A0A171DJY5_9ACTN|nr:putative lasso peptide precursor [Planomonospora sphaerica]
MRKRYESPALTCEGTFFEKTKGLPIGWWIERPSGWYFPI